MLSFLFYIWLLKPEVKVISKNKDFIMNEEIREKEIRVIDSNGEAIGIIPTKEALEIAHRKELDLVVVSPNAKPMVCKIMDFGKFVYEQQKKEKEAKKKQKVTVLKEIRCSLTIEENDIAIKARNARKFLLDGDKVKVTIRFKGREATLGHLGKNILDKFVSILEDVCIVEKGAKHEGRNMTMVLAPKKA